MKLRENQRRTVRECGVDWHCHEVTISQPGLVDGYEFNGYGIIKSHESGGLYLDFICLKTNKRVDFGIPIPKDAFDKNQRVMMKATTIGGVQVSSNDLTIKIDFQQMLEKDPKFYRLPLKSVEICDETDLSVDGNSYLHMEFSEKIRVPFNKSNTIESSLGSKSFSWNQAVISCEDCEVNVVQHKNFTEVYAKAKNTDLDVLREAIVFYVGFTSGLFIQPYFEFFKDSSSSKSKINSVDIKRSRKSIPQPIPNLAHDQDRKSMDHFHYELFQNILKMSSRRADHFESLYSQWSRIWHSFMSPEISVSMLTLSVAIEGVLNDIFIPVIDELLKDERFENEKSRLKALISSIDDVSKDHVDSLHKYIDKWGNTHAEKALKYLVQREIISDLQQKCWSKLRNSSAHPKLLKQDDARMRKNIERTVVCLGLFYRLTLNALSYRGAQYVYEAPKDERVVVYEHIDLLNERA
ncbi:MAG: hypothetical protein ACOY3E_00640 [Pseudomonadota bacterium]